MIEMSAKAGALVTFIETEAATRPATRLTTLTRPRRTR